MNITSSTLQGFRGMLRTNRIVDLSNKVIESYNFDPFVIEHILSYKIDEAELLDYYHNGIKTDSIKQLLTLESFLDFL